MSNRPFIVLGDRTDHGGTVITADPTCFSDFIPMARVKDMTHCPRCKGSFEIVTGAADLVDGTGNAYARHGDQTACGAKLLAHQVLTYWGEDPSAGDPAAAEKAAARAEAAKIATATDSGICLECLLQAATAGSATVIRG